MTNAVGPKLLSTFTELLQTRERAVNIARDNHQQELNLAAERLTASQ